MSFRMKLVQEGPGSHLPSHPDTVKVRHAGGSEINSLHDPDPDLIPSLCSSYVLEESQRPGHRPHWRRVRDSNE